jgi:hypothetical protein
MSTEENKIKQVDTIFDTAMSEANKIYGEGGAADTLVDTYETNQGKLIEQQDEYLVSRLDQQKKQAEQSYTQEQSAAYSDYQKQVDPYGVQAEQLAANGLSNSGYAESLKTQAYVAYQNRVAVARQAYQQAVVDFNNAFTEAKMQNDSQRASLAYQVLQMRFENLISGFTYNHQLRMDKANALINVADATGDYQSLYEMVYADLEKNYNNQGGEADTVADDEAQSGDASASAQSTSNFGQVNSKQRANYILRTQGIDPSKLAKEDKILNAWEWQTAKSSGAIGEEYEAKTYSQYANIALAKIIAKYKATGTANIDNFV